MELREGYKQTEIGVIPEEWEVVSFENAFHFLSTASYSRAEITTIGEIKYVHYGDIHTKLNHFLDFNSFKLPSIKKEQLKTYNLIKEGDLIMADASEDYEGIGKSVEVKNIKTKNAISGLHTFLLRGKDDIFSNGFKAYLHSNKLVKTQYDKLATGLKVYGVSKGNLKQILIPLPPLPEQTAIATVLSETDKLLQALQKKIDKKRLIKQGAMQKLLKPKEGWVVKRLGEVVFNTQLGGNYQNSEIITKYPLIKMGNILRGNISLSKLEYIPDTEKINDRDRLKRGDVIFNTRNTLELVGKVAIWNNELPQSYFNSNIMRLKFKDSIISSNRFMNYSFNSKKTIGDLKNIATGTTSVAAIYTRDLLKITFLIPEKKEQTRIATILSDMDTELENLEKQVAKYKRVKQGLMQNLLTGKIRLL